MKKTLIVKLSTDVSEANPAQIAALKAFWRASFEPTGLPVDFEITESDEMSLADRLLSLVRSEFKEHDEASEEQAEKPALFLLTPLNQDGKDEAESRDEEH